MIKNISYIVVMILVTASQIFAQSNQSASNNAGEKRLKKWAIENSIATKYFYTEGSGQNWRYHKKERAIFISPNGENLFFVSHRGDLYRDCNTYTLEVHSTKNILDALKNKKDEAASWLVPIREITLSSGSNYPAIEEARWTEDGKSILFLAAENKRLPHICKLDVVSGKIENIEADPSFYSEIKEYNSTGSTLIFEQLKSEEAKYPEFETYPAFVAPAKLLSNMLFREVREKTMYYIYHNGKVNRLPSLYVDKGRLEDGAPKIDLLNGRQWFVLSPDGNKIIVVQTKSKSEVSSAWRAYYMPSGSDGNNIENGSSELFLRFMVIDVNQNNKVLPLIDAPLGIHTAAGYRANILNRVVWSADSKYVILSSSALPIEDKPDSMAYVVAINITTGKYQALEPVITQHGTVYNLSWNKEGNEILIDYKDDKNNSTIIGYKRNGDQWSKDLSLVIDNEKQTNTQQLPAGLNVFIQEDVNTAPRIVASNSKNRIYLTGPDSTLQNVYIAPTRTIQFEVGGRTVTGGLTLPKNYDKSKPLPLVIQVYCYSPELFRPDGTHGSGYAMQPLVAKGIAVLQLKLNSYSPFGPGHEDIWDKIDSASQEGPFFVEKIDAAVKMLADSGIVDPNRVGLTGFSRGCYETLYAITHPGKIKLAAAVGEDGFAGSFFTYTHSGLYPDVDDFEGLYNGSFWENKAAWLKDEPIFNIDKVKTPLLLNHHHIKNLADILNEKQDLIFGFSRTKHPLELMLYTDGSHILQRPLERYTSLEAIVDWMNFWLQGKEDPDPLKAEKYERWHELRKMQDAVLKEQM